MTVYVDNMEADFGRMKMCHMVSDESLEELHQMADAIGIQRKWFQDKSVPHYDIAKSKRKLALEKGAVEVALGSHDWIRISKAARQLGKPHD